MEQTNIISTLDLCEEELIPGLPYDIALECLLRVPITCHPTLRLVSNYWRATLCEDHFFMLRHRAAVSEHLVFMIQPLSPSLLLPQQKKEKDGEVEEETGFDGGSSLLYDLSVYNDSRKEWGSLGGITIPTFAQCVVLRDVGKVIVLGGWDPATLEPVPRVLVIDLVVGTWKEGCPMSTARSFFACAAVGPASVYVAGGHDGQKNALRAAEVYDVEADTWRTLPDMVYERDEPHGVVFGGVDDSKFWVISGYGTESQGRFRSDAEIYDPKTSTWSHQDGVWPYLGHTPKSTVVLQQQRWISIINGESREFDSADNSWKILNLGLIPKSVIESPSISLVEMGDDRIMVMGNGEKCGEECNGCGCGGEGVYMVEKTSQGNNKGGINWSWQHVHTPSRYLGFPFSSSYLSI